MGEMKLLIVFFLWGYFGGLKPKAWPIVKAQSVLALKAVMLHAPKGSCCFSLVLLSVHNRPKDNHTSIVSEPPGCSYSNERKKEIHRGPEWGSREIQNELWSKSDFSPSLFLTSCELL